MPEGVLPTPSEIEKVRTLRLEWLPNFFQQSADAYVTMQEADAHQPYLEAMADEQAKNLQEGPVAEALQTSQIQAVEQLGIQAQNETTYQTGLRGAEVSAAEHNAEIVGAQAEAAGYEADMIGFKADAAEADADAAIAEAQKRAAVSTMVQRIWANLEAAKVFRHNATTVIGIGTFLLIGGAVVTVLVYKKPDDSIIMKEQGGIVAITTRFDRDTGERPFIAFQALPGVVIDPDGIVRQATPEAIQHRLERNVLGNAMVILLTEMQCRRLRQNRLQPKMAKIDNGEEDAIIDLED